MHEFGAVSDSAGANVAGVELASRRGKKGGGVAQRIGDRAAVPGVVWVAALLVAACGTSSLGGAQPHGAEPTAAGRAQRPAPSDAEIRAFLRQHECLTWTRGDVDGQLAGWHPEASLIRGRDATPDEYDIVLTGPRVREHLAVDRPYLGNILTIGLCEPGPAAPLASIAEFAPRLPVAGPPLSPIGVTFSIESIERREAIHVEARTTLEVGPETGINFGRQYEIVVAAGRLSIRSRRSWDPILLPRPANHWHDLDVAVARASRRGDRECWLQRLAEAHHWHELRAALARLNGNARLSRWIEWRTVLSTFGEHKQAERLLQRVHDEFGADRMARDLRAAGADRCGASAGLGAADSTATPPYYYPCSADDRAALDAVDPGSRPYCRPTDDDIRSTLAALDSASVGCMRPGNEPLTLSLALEPSGSLRIVELDGPGMSEHQRQCIQHAVSEVAGPRFNLVPDPGANQPPAWLVSHTLRSNGR